MENTHIAYSDESNHTASKFGSICLITGDKESISFLEKDLEEALESSSVKEFKFNQINSGKMIHCGLKIIDKIFPYILNEKIRVDVLIWSPQERDQHLPENPKKVFGKMYYHLLNHVLGSRWEGNLVWAIYPDKQSLIDWGEMKQILENTDNRISISKKEDGGSILEIICKHNICEIEEVDSMNSPICQVADLFAGIGSSGHLRKEALVLYDDCQIHLGGELIDNTNKDIGKIRVMSHLRKKCRDNGFKIDFSPNKGIKTLDPSNWINFWLFKHTLERHKNKNLSEFFH